MQLDDQGTLILAPEKWESQKESAENKFQISKAYI